MKDQTNVENKGLPPTPFPLGKGSSGAVKIKIRQGRAVEGVGKSGDVVSVDAAIAKRLIEIGYADYADKEN